MVMYIILNRMITDAIKKYVVNSGLSFVHVFLTTSYHDAKCWGCELRL